MLVKCETKSSRVKGLSFHPKLTWILASLHNGIVQLWDFRLGCLIDQFEEHEGPVRGVDFHASQPLFVSGGDDYQIKLWNYRQRRCIFTLLGHLDYIRTVVFHPEYPWILSASDDQTVRLWNWQSRSCIAVLAGHNHYVMCAQFHSSQQLLISSSLDQTIRIWDISGLTKKAGALQNQVSVSTTLNMGAHYLSSSESNSAASQQSYGRNAGNFIVLNAQHVDAFSTSDAVCKMVLEGHDRGVNWAVFHPTITLIASGSDDRLVKLWRYNETKYWEIETFRGHLHNVSSVLFHPTKDLLLSNSEDRTIRIWDITKRVQVHTFRRENDRFWTIAALPGSNTLAVGHDSGTVVFKLDRERPAAYVLKNQIFYVKDRWVQVFDTVTNTTTSLVTCRSAVNAMSNATLSLVVNPLNPTELNILILYDIDGNVYDLITSSLIHGSSASNVITKQGVGDSVAFITRNRYAVLEANGTLSIFNFNCVLSKRMDLAVTTDKIFYAGNNRLLLKSNEKLCLLDVGSRKILGEITCPGGVRYVYWSQDENLVALICKHHVLLASNKLELFWSTHENLSVKGGAWDMHGTFVYTTLSHIKYCLPNGDNGIIQCLSQPIYLLKVDQNKCWVIERKTRTVKSIALDCTEYMFKLALYNKNFDQVALLIRNSRLCGSNIVKYLREKRFPNVALQFVSDPETRFSLAVEDANLQEAMRTAIELDNADCWDRLALAATRQGSFEMAELVYQQTKNLQKLSFLYFLSGDFEKLARVSSIAEAKNDIQSRLYNALLLGDVEERIRILTEVGLLSLAAAAANTYGLTEITNALEEAGYDLETSVEKTEPLPSVKPLIESNAQLVLKNWPKLVEITTNFESIMQKTSRFTPEVTPLNLQKKLSPTRVKSDVPGFDSFDIDEEVEDQDGAGWFDLDDTIDDIGDYHEEKSLTSELQKDEWSISPGDQIELIWCQGQPNIASLVAAGQYGDALLKLAKRIGLINAKPLEPLFKKISVMSHAFLPMFPFVQSKRLPFFNNGSLLAPAPPVNMVSVSTLSSLLKNSHKLVTAGKIDNAFEEYQKMLHLLIFAQADTAEENSQLHELLSVVEKYAEAMLLEKERKKIENTDQKRSIELAAYLGCYALQSVHQLLVLRRAMIVAWKAQNFVTSATFARRIIQKSFVGKTVDEVTSQAKKILVASERKGTEAYSIDFEPSDTKICLCTKSFTRIKPNDAFVKCPYCGAAVKSTFNGQLCSICDLSKLGAKVIGIQFQSVTFDQT